MDNDMNSILRNMDAAAKGETRNGTPSAAASEKNAMKGLLEGLDAAQRKVNQMPADHKMAKNGKKHPASKYLVGGEDGKPDAGDEVVSEVEEGAYDGDDYGRHEWPTKGMTDWADGADGHWGDDAAPGIQVGDNVHIGHVQAGASGVEGRVIRIDGDIVFVKNAEGRTYKGQLKNTTVNEGIHDGPPTKTVDKYGNTSYKLDGKLHRLDGPAYINAGGYGRFYVHGKHVSQAEMEQHADEQVPTSAVEEDTIAKREAPRQQMNKKQSFAEIFKSMEEASEEKEFNMEKDFHNKIQQEKALTKGENGKFNLADAEEAPKLSTKDARTSQLIKKARSQYSGRADDDLSAVVAMMTDKDEQLDTYDHDQDSDIVHNDVVNNQQEVDINDILQRLEKLEMGESVTEAAGSDTKYEEMILAILPEVGRHQMFMGLHDKLRKTYGMTPDIGKMAKTLDKLKAEGKASRITNPFGSDGMGMWGLAEITTEADAKMPATRDRAIGDRNDDKYGDDTKAWPKGKRTGQRAGRYLKGKHGLGQKNPNAADYYDDTNEGIADTQAQVSSVPRTKDNKLNTKGRIKVKPPRGKAYYFKTVDDAEMMFGMDMAEIERKATVTYPKVEEAVVPYDGDDQDKYPFWDDETGEVFRAGTNSEVNFDDDNEGVGKQYWDEPEADDPGETNPKMISGAKLAQAYSMFGDIAAGGGDPIDHLITNMGLEMGLIDSMAQDEGYADANDWAQSYQEMESVIRTSNMINKRN